MRGWGEDIHAFVLVVLEVRITFRVRPSEDSQAVTGVTVALGSTGGSCRSLGLGLMLLLEAVAQR